jgi:hypothetical protein
MSDVVGLAETTAAEARALLVPRVAPVERDLAPMDGRVMRVVAGMLAIVPGVMAVAVTTTRMVAVDVGRRRDPVMMHFHHRRVSEEDLAGQQEVRRSDSADVVRDRPLDVVRAGGRGREQRGAECRRERGGARDDPGSGARIPMLVVAAHLWLLLLRGARSCDRGPRSDLTKPRGGYSGTSPSGWDRWEIGFCLLRIRLHG